MKEIRLQVLKAKIRGFEAEAMSLRKQINRLTGEKRCPVWERKRALGTYTREHLVAYGLLRRIPYQKIEQKVGKENPLDLDAVLEVIHVHVYRFERQKWTKERLSELVSRVEAPK